MKIALSSKANTLYSLAEVHRRPQNPATFIVFVVIIIIIIIIILYTALYA
jgi:hypothetical protein